ncbi:MAG: branched-chain amino acid ABC transporter substrate-binding protein [Pseudomonadota bacterium]
MPILSRSRPDSSDRAAQKGRRRFGRVGALFAAGILAVWAGSAARAEIVIGVAVPLSGQFEAFGKDILLGVNLAVQRANAENWAGEPVRVVAEDDKCTEEGGRDAANRLIGARVSAVIGHMCWRASVAGSGLYHENGIVQISPATRYAKLTDERPDPNGGVYRLIGRADRQAPALTTFIAERFARSRIAFVHDNSPYGKGLASSVQAGLAEQGIRDVLFNEFEPGQDAYSGLVSRINDALAEVVVIGGFFGDAAVIVRTMRARGMTQPMIGGDTLGAAEFWTIAGDAGGGTLFSAPVDPRTLPDAAALVSDITGRDQAPQPYSLYGYGALQILTAALSDAGSNQFEALVQAMNDTPFETILGTVRFDDNGDSDVPSFTIYEWAGGNTFRFGE